MTPHPVPATWTVDPSARSTAARADASVGKRHRGRGLGREPGEDDGEAVLGEEPLHPGEHGGDGGKHGVEGPHDPRLLQGPVERGVLAVLQEDRHDPRDDERHHHGHRHTEHRVDRTRAAAGAGDVPSAPRAAGPGRPRWWPRRSGRSSATSALAVVPCTTLATEGASSAPRTRPSRRPPKVSTCMAAPSRSPWMPDSATMTSST